MEFKSKISQADSHFSQVEMLNVFQTEIKRHGKQISDLKISFQKLENSSKVTPDESKNNSYIQPVVQFESRPQSPKFLQTEIKRP